MDTEQCGYWLFNSVNSTGYYNPKGLSTNGEAATDPTAMRHGQPQEILDCGKGGSSTSPSSDTGSNTGSGIPKPTSTLPQEDDDFVTSQTTVVVKSTNTAQNSNKQGQTVLHCKRSVQKRSLSRFSSLFWRKRTRAK